VIYLQHINSQLHALANAQAVLTPLRGKGAWHYAQATGRTLPNINTYTD